MSSIQGLSSAQMVTNLQVAAQSKQTTAPAGAIERPTPAPQAPVTVAEIPDSPVQAQTESFKGRQDADVAQMRNEPKPVGSTFSVLA